MRDVVSGADVELQGAGVEPTTDDGERFEPFYVAEYGRVVMLAWTLTGDRARAEELAHDAFEAAYRRWDEVRDYDDAGAWVRRVVVNKSASRVRRVVSERRALTRLWARESRSVDAELQLPDEPLWTALRSLPARQRQVMSLHYVEDRAVADIARILEMAESTVKVHLHRGRRALAARLGEGAER